MRTKSIIIGLMSLLIMSCMPDIAHKRRKAFIRIYPRISEYWKHSIKRGDLVAGMTKEAVEASIGKPVKINRSVDTRGIFEQWVYPKSERQIREYAYVYFNNEKLITWQYF